MIAPSADRINAIAGFVLILLMGLALLAGPSKAVDYPAAAAQGPDSPAANPDFRHNGE